MATINNVNDYSDILDTLKGSSHDDNAYRRLVPLFYDELRSLAHRHLRNQNSAFQLQTTELVHETYIKLVRHSNQANDRGHFFSLAAKAMRHILVDMARKDMALKRGQGKTPITFNDEIPADFSDTKKWLEIDEALIQLKDVNQRMVDVVECRFFAGFTEDETAQALNVNVRTIQRDWRRAKLWLQQFLSEVYEGKGNNYQIKRPRK